MISALHDAPCDHAFDLQVVRHDLRIDLAPLVVKHGRARHNRQIRNLRQTIDQTLSNSVAQILAFGSLLTLTNGSTAIEEISWSPARPR
jgi:hypothetical protein